MPEPERIDVIIARWVARQAEWQRLRISVDGAAIAEEVVADLQRIAAADAGELLTLEDAARRSGYTADHLGALVRRGKLRNHGRRGRPLVQWSEVPRKPAALTPAPTLGIVPGADRRSLARSALTDQERSANGR